MDREERNQLLHKLIEIDGISKRGHTHQAQQETLRVIMKLIMEIYDWQHPNMSQKGTADGDKIME